MLTVILTARNRADLIGPTLASILAQSLRPFKVIAVDNGSTDSTDDIIKEWAQSAAEAGIDARVISEHTPGACAARNAGLAAADTDRVLFFDSDDIMRPGHLERIDACFEANPDTELLGFDSAEIDSDGWTTLHSCSDADIMRGHILHASFATQRFAASTELVRAVGGWDTSLPRWNDLELGVRLIARASKIDFIHGNPGVVERHGSDCLSAAGFAADAANLERAIDKIEETLRYCGREDDFVWADVKRMVLAGLISRESSTPAHKEAARRIASKALDGHGKAERLKLKAVRSAVRLCGHGGCALATMILGKKEAEAAPGKRFIFKRN